ncbi:hypothetical protein Hanom_Chr17g01580851 [Helianthus anomalus]
MMTMMVHGGGSGILQRQRERSETLISDNGSLATSGDGGAAGLGLGSICLKVGTAVWTPTPRIQEWYFGVGADGGACNDKRHSWWLFTVQWVRFDASSARFLVRVQHLNRVGSDFVSTRSTPESTRVNIRSTKSTTVKQSTMVKRSKSVKTRSTMTR